METIEQHVERMLGTPWVQGSDDIENGGLDCFGGCTYAHRCVTGVSLPTPPWRKQCDTNKALRAAVESGNYKPVDKPQDLDIFVCLSLEGVAIHCGLYVKGYAYHITGSVRRKGSAALWEFPQVEQVYGKVKYYTVVNKNG